MHSFLPAIGFRQIKKKSQFQKLLESIIASPDGIMMVPTDEESCYTVFTKEVEDGIGLAVCGETDDDGVFQMEHHFPYILSKTCSTRTECLVRRQSDKESYTGVCDDIRLGFSLIFYLNNFMEHKKIREMKIEGAKMEGICLSALSVNGKIILPIKKTEKQMERVRRDNAKCISLMEAARDGDPEAIEDLAVRDMNLYTQAKERAAKQDIYSFVEGFFMPYGVECDQYSVMGCITAWKKTANRLTGEDLYILDIQCNDIPLRICIGEADLTGVPKIGCRFKGDIWLQGRGIFTLD